MALIILAAGMGTRFQHALPKQYLKLGRKPVFIHATLPFIEACGRSLKHIIVACPDSYRAQTERQLEGYIPKQTSVTVVTGGTKRLDSIFKGIAQALKTTDAEIILVHDAARPLIHPEDIKGLVRSFKKGKWDAGILGKPLAESLFVKRSGMVHGVNREEYCFGETPFMYTRNVARHMYERWSGKTDRLHATVDLTELVSREGKYHTGVHDARHPNVKLTYPGDDLIIRRYAQGSKHAKG